MVIKIILRLITFNRVSLNRVNEVNFKIHGPGIDSARKNINKISSSSLK